MRRLNQAWSSYLTGGVFQTLATGRTMPWATDTAITAASLDYLYHLNHSGQKWSTPAIEALLDGAATYTGELTTEDKGVLVTMIWTMFHQKWTKLWATLNFQYNPIENYDRTETKEGTDTTTQTPNNWKSETSGLAADNEAKTEAKTYGFNTATAVPSGETVTSAKNKQTTEQSGTYETETEYDTEIKVHGNIGVTTSQQMIQSERELWFWDYFDQVFMDVDSVLTLLVY